jgi:hypothetical protein
MASTGDNGMGEEVAARDGPVRSTVKRLHSSHDSGMESEYEFDGTHVNFLVGTKLGRFALFAHNDDRQSLYNAFFIS